ncbi:MAG: CRISPR-associated endonuclease Cas1 [Candidatus Sericytochromatia bacterium]|nr:CRISPR-associated endonuclease Cas1 [Candidatus Sericytochromatia bacterium]
MGHNLVVVEPDLSLGLEKEMLVLRRNQEIVRRSKLQDLDQVLLMGRQELSAAARHALLQRGIDVLFLTVHGKYLGRLSNYLSRNGPLRLAQYRVCSDPAQSLTLARAFVSGKLTAQRRLMLRQQRELKNEQLTQALAGLRQMQSQLERAPAIDSLMGCEGRAAALYFGVFPRFIQAEGFPMQGRSKRPPRDAVNAALSFGYTMLTYAVESAVLKAGLDPYLGCLHQPRQGLPALVLDLMEAFRPVLIDSLILRLINREQLRPGDFYHPQESALAEAILAEEGNDNISTEPDPRPAVYLNETGRRIFFQAWYARLRESVFYPAQNRQLSYSDVIQQQVYHLARVLQNEEPAYLPFVPR